MTIVVKCPGCESTRKLKEEAKGRAIVCKECGQRFRVQTTAQPLKKLKVKQKTTKSKSKPALKENSSNTVKKQRENKQKIKWPIIIGAVFSIIASIGIYVVVFSTTNPVEGIAKEEMSSKSETKPEPFETEKNRIPEISLAVMNHVDMYSYFPATDGKGLNRPEYKHGNLSWRVFILPYLEQMDLYKKFNLDEPWDSPNNKPLVKRNASRLWR